MPANGSGGPLARDHIVNCLPQFGGRASFEPRLGKALVEQTVGVPLGRAVKAAREMRAHGLGFRLVELTPTEERKAKPDVGAVVRHGVGLIGGRSPSGAF